MDYNRRGKEFRMIVYNAACIGNLARIKIFIEPNRVYPEWISGCLNDSFNEQFPLVIAARKGHVEIVKYLLEVGAEPSVAGVVEFDNDDIRGTPPLWAAAAAGHMEIVKELVENAKANINQTTESNSTPLRGACYDGHFEIVKYLVDKGAGINIPNRHGHTSLMIAAYRNKIDVVRLLLEHKADVNVQTAKGNSALHDAAECGNCEIVQLLIDSGAVMSKDFQGVCPLFCAAISGHEEVVEILLEQAKSNITRRDALKLLGCTMVDKKMDSHLAMKYWRQALEIELTPDEQNTIRHFEAFTEPLEAYDNETEIHYIENLSSLEGNVDNVRMQALIIRERVLGGAHTDVHYYLRFRGAVYCDLGQMNRCYTLWKHALELQQKHFSPLHVGTVTTLQSFEETFGMTLNDYVNAMHVDRSLRVSSSWVNYVFEKICYELERVRDWGDKPLQDAECCGENVCPHTSVEAEQKKLVVAALQLINVIERLSLPSANGDDIEDKMIPLDIDRLVKICHILHLPILHYSLEETIGESVDYMSLPKASVLAQILENNVDTTACDKDGNSVIHVLLKAATIRRSLIHILLENGALLFACNNDGEIVYEQLKEIIIKEKCKDLKLGKFITLAGLAAHTIRRKSENENVENLDDILPAELVPFLRKH
ncbi:unnamed protein product [Caenorhabditis angaria]|uniref:Sex-determining protein fem-1 n=1 Tax=Caenorhabditis angaria TaxID=860376 RepID=A0A9P1N1Z4_9PELO|nr:unnamed protein product [Caenorhabditis angaria]